MRGPAALALMSLLLIHGEAQPLSQPTVEQSEGASYTKSFDCDGSSQLLKDDSGHTLTCNGNKVRVCTTMTCWQTQYLIWDTFLVPCVMWERQGSQSEHNYGKWCWQENYDMRWSLLSPTSNILSRLPLLWQPRQWRNRNTWKLAWCGHT